eukprot:6716630-Prymnesium_polylepis.2
MRLRATARTARPLLRRPATRDVCKPSPVTRPLDEKLLAVDNPPRVERWPPHSAPPATRPSVRGPREICGLKRGWPVSGSAAHGRGRARGV